MTASSSIQPDARRLSILFDCGAISVPKIISWADEQIIKNDSPSDDLLSLSMTPPEKTADIISLLHKLGNGADFWLAFKASLPQFHEFLLAHPDRCEGVANQFYHIACRSRIKVPIELNFLYQFDDEFDLVGAGICGKWEDVYKDFLAELDKFNPK